jgi:hypothetical protein
MEQRTAILFPTLKRFPASAIPAELKSVYQTEALALSTMKQWCKHFAEGETSLSDDPRCGRRLLNDIAEAISSILKERLYLSFKVLCRHFCIVKGTCLRILHNTFGMRKFDLR